MSEPYDPRMYAAFDSWKVEHPDGERSEQYTPFMAGWRLRTEAAAASEAGEDFAIIIDWVDIHRRDAHRIYSQTVETYLDHQRTLREVAHLRAMIQSLGGKYEDAPLASRIQHQRNELARLNAENAMLRQASNGVQPDSPEPKLADRG